MPVSRAETCPDCDYDLHGLPHMHLCPECGFEFNGTMTIFRPARPRIFWVSLAIASAVVLFGGLWPIVFKYHGDFGSARSLEWLFLLGGGLWAALCVRPFIRAGGWRYAIIEQDALLVRRGNHKRAIAWEQVRSVWLWPTMSVWVFVSGSPDLLRIRGVFDEFDDARRFAQQVRARARLARRRAHR